MFEAQAVWKTEKEGEFTPAGFSVEVDLSINHELGMDKTEELFGYMRDNRCDGFIIDYGTGKRHFIRS